MRRLTKEILKEPTVRCSYCGREFSKPVAHKCRGGFRKHHLKWIKIMAYKPASCDQICQGCEKNASGWCVWKDTPVIPSAVDELVAKESLNILDSRYNFKK